MATQKQIAKIHILKSELKLSDDEYRAVLSQFGAESSKDLNAHDTNAVIDALSCEGARREGKAYSLPGIAVAPGMATLAQQAMIGDLIRAAHGTIEYPRSWMSRVARHHLIDGAQELTKAEASKVIDALRRHNKNLEK